MPPATLTAVPRVIDYPAVAEAMAAAGLMSLYHNSGSFGFPRDAAGIRHVGWVGPPDATIRAAARVFVRHVPSPFEWNLAQLASVVWQEHLPGAAWVLPRSHWAYELTMGSWEWMPGLLRDVGVDPDVLLPRNDGSAIEFLAPERGAFTELLSNLLANLLGSDFALAFPGRRVICTVHHHKQLWWTTDEQEVAGCLDRLVPPTPHEAG